MKPSIFRLGAGPNPWHMRIATRTYRFPSQEEAINAAAFILGLDVPWKPANATAAAEPIPAGGPKA